VADTIEKAFYGQRITLLLSSDAHFGKRILNPLNELANCY